MGVAIAMPKLGMTMQEGTVLEWRVELGGTIAKGEVLLLVESEKAEIEIDAPADGVLRHIYVEPGELVPCGTLLAALTGSAEEDFDAEAFRADHDGKAPQRRSTAAGSSGAARTGSTAATTAASSAAPASPAAARSAPTPAARAAARRLGVDVDSAAASGPGGRITREDVESYAERMAARIEVADGVHLDVEIRGEGQPVVLLPGFGSDASAFAPQLPALAKHYRVHAVNPRGTGFSDAPETDRYDIATAAEDASRVAEGPLHVVGASLGAAVAIEMALVYPQRLRSLVLITPFVTASPRLAAVAEAWCAAARAGAEVLGRALVPWMFSQGFLADGVSRERAARAIAQTSGRIAPPVLERWHGAIQAWSATRSGDLQRIAVPTLVVVAAEDLLTPQAAAVAEAIPGARTVIVEEAGHAVSIEKAADVTRALLEHIRAHA